MSGADELTARLEQVRKKNVLTWVGVACIPIAVLAISGHWITVLQLVGFGIGCYVVTLVVLNMLDRPKTVKGIDWYNVQVPSGRLTEHGFEVSRPVKLGRASVCVDGPLLRLRLGSNQLEFKRDDTSSVEIVVAQRWPSVGYVNLSLTGGGFVYFRTNVVKAITSALVSSGWPLADPT